MNPIDVTVDILRKGVLILTCSVEREKIQFHMINNL